MSRPLTKKEIQQMVKAFAKTAKLCKDAGYDMLNCDNGTYDSWYAKEMKDNNIEIRFNSAVTNADDLKDFDKVEVHCKFIDKILFKSILYGKQKDYEAQLTKLGLVRNDRYFWKKHYR